MRLRIFAEDPDGGRRVSKEIDVPDDVDLDAAAVTSREHMIDMFGNETVRNIQVGWEEIPSTPPGG